MQVDDIRRLVKLVEESEIDELEIRRWWTVVRILKRRNGKGEEKTVVVTAPALTQPTMAAPVILAPPPSTSRGVRTTDEGGPAPAEPERTAERKAADEGLSQIRSPMVGTFYRSPSPGAPPFTDSGARVSVGQVVCLVEAMKLMNEIEAEVAGTIARVMVENGHPVEFGQPLFLVRPD